ncbi:MAG TPA: PASTA domain-containing protein [Actinomycetota bacterium]|nr:PASTA domain-containing protein [Actinomycetota bacterium]
MEPTAPAAPERPRRRLGWPTVVIALATLLLGGFIGYAAGRPNESPPVQGALSPGEVRVPDLRGVDAADARAILGPLHLQVGAIGLQDSDDAPRGIVFEQDPPGGAAVPAGTGVDLVASSGPGPGASARYEFARSVLLPITHVGTIEWTSDPIALAGDPVSLGANTRVIGDAGVSPYRISMAKDTEPGATAITVSVDVSSFRTPAWFLIERAFTRQRESPTIDPNLSATPPSGPPGTVVTLEGNQCQGATPATSVTVTAELSRGAGRPYATVPLSLPGAAYAFRMTFTIPGSVATPTGTKYVQPPDRVTFVTSGGACRSAPFVVR